MFFKDQREVEPKVEKVNWTFPLKIVVKNVSMTMWV